MSANPFAQATEAAKTQTSDVRTLGVPASAVYGATCTAAYLLPNNFDSSATDMVFHFDLDSGYKHVEKMTVLRNGSPMVQDKKTKKTVPMFTFLKASRLVGALTDGKTVEDVVGSIAKKQIALYDFDQKKDVNTEVQMIMDLVKKPVLLGLQRKIANKNQNTGEKDENGQTIWIPLAEKKETLVYGTSASKADRRSYVEMEAGTTAEDATDLDTWEKRNKGKDWNAYKPVTGAASGMPDQVTAQASGAQVEEF